MELRGNISYFINITEAKLHYVNILDVLIAEPGTILVMDPGYLHFERLYGFHQAGESFVIRIKSNTDLSRLYSNRSFRDKPACRADIDR